MTEKRLQFNLPPWQNLLVGVLLGCGGPVAAPSGDTSHQATSGSVPSSGSSSGGSGALGGSGATESGNGGPPATPPDAETPLSGTPQGGADADLPDAPSPTGVPEAGGGPPGACNHLFCEDFEAVAEGSPPDPAIWTRTSNDLLVDGVHAALGSKKALHIPPLLTGAKYIRESKTIAAMGKAFYGRVFFWIEQQPLEKPGSLYHWTLLSADELVDYNAGKVLRLGGHIEGAGTNWVRFNFQTHGNPGETGLSDPTLVLSTKRWYCAEFYYSLTDNEARIWLDGVEDPKLHWKGPMGGYTFPTAVTWMTFGWAEYQAAKTPWEIWIDEIAIDTKQIGCN
jgi:hypothetical protein